jgi:hypothetical protein
VKNKIVLFLSIILVFSLLADGIDVRADFADDVEEEASSIDALALFLQAKDSGQSRRRHPASKSLAQPRSFGAQAENFLSAARIKKPSSFLQQELYSLQRVYRL